MTFICVTGACGFLGSNLIERLLSKGLGSVGKQEISVIAMDLKIDPDQVTWASDKRVTCVTGDFSCNNNVAILAKYPPNVLFHLASMPAGAAEKDPISGTETNLTSTLRLFSFLANTAEHWTPRVVFASSIAVYGPLPPGEPVNDATPTKPALSYGTHKLMAEYFLADLHRRHDVSALSMRLPAIVARPASSGGHGSSFMSEVIRCLSQGTPFICPVSKESQAWWLSCTRAVDNLVHAALLPAESIPPSATIQVPALTATMSEIVEAIGDAYTDTNKLISYKPDPELERNFGRYPALDTRAALALGFKDDGSVKQLISNALN